MLFLFVLGDLTLTTDGTIASNGSPGGDTAHLGGAGGSGGGVVAIAHAGKLTNYGSITATGGNGGDGNEVDGGQGGDGSISILQVLA